MTLQLRNLSVAIHDTPILRDVALEIALGEICAITGESGSGKSMTALAVMQLLPHGAEVSGTIHLSETEITAQSEAQMCQLRGNEIGMIFQEPMTALNPVMSIGDQVAETLLVHGKATPEAARQRAEEVLARVGLTLPLTRFPHELSGGQRQRVGIAMAIALRPKLLIADEPTTALDVTTQAQILDLLTQLVREDGMALMMITHDLAVVSDMADRIAVMQHGQIVETAPTQTLLAEMQHPYTRALFTASSHRASLPPADPGPPVLEANAVTRAYPLPRELFRPRKHHIAVKDVSFTIGAGERVGLVGESGCGKSTLTRALLGLERLQSGSIAAFGQPVGPDMPAVHRAKVQVVFQDPYGSFNPRHRVARLVTEPFHLLPDPPQGAARNAAIDQALEAVGLSPSDADKYIHEFSGGQRQRIAIARALINAPELIVFDEAVSALDVQVRAQILDLIARLTRERGMAYLFISHDLSVVRGITDRVMVMKDGAIVEDGPTAQVLETPAHPYTQTLLAAAPVLPEMEALNG
ncbi:ABC transporter ATP-binding protein [Pseudaestuariivita sp.]|uniref:ABC transporter ATP-binding protein n=1 Tax=Pseudaestuariivita sp. TaxID=2211669 RepID=UPI0040582668